MRDPFLKLNQEKKFPKHGYKMLRLTAIAAIFFSIHFFFQPVFFKFGTILYQGEILIGLSHQHDLRWSLSIIRVFYSIFLYSTYPIEKKGYELQQNSKNSLFWQI